MPLKASYRPYTFTFGFDARTSRGAMNDKLSWFINIWDDSNPTIIGIGESGPLPGLSVETIDIFEEMVVYAIERINKANLKMNVLGASLNDLNNLLSLVLGSDFLRHHPSIAFAFETALLDLRNNGARIIFHNEFNKGKSLPINGLVWMGSMDFMRQQVSKKIDEGFSCIKLKVGGLDFEQECDLLRYIRQEYDHEKITLRLDANGAFLPNEAMAKLDALAKFNIHSIEQPIKAGLGAMRLLCENSPIPIALDEELIGVYTTEAKIDLLEKTKPQFIILKPTLHGGLYSCQEWIALAEERNIGWWITSALESNIGLNAIAQFAANYNITLPQGLGTGGIYKNNIESPLKVEKGFLFINSDNAWDASAIS
jgi:O-succinylbenzoate synthase